MNPANSEVCAYTLPTYSVITRLDTELQGYVTVLSSTLYNRYSKRKNINHLLKKFIEHLLRNILKTSMKGNFRCQWVKGRRTNMS